MAEKDEQTFSDQVKSPGFWWPLFGLVTAVALVLAVMLWRSSAEQQPEQDDMDMFSISEELLEPPAGSSVDGFDVLATTDDMELIEELDFYDWLETAEEPG